MTDPRSNEPFSSNASPSSGADDGLWGTRGQQPAGGDDLAAKRPLHQSAMSGKNGPAWERDVLERLVFATLREQRAARRWRIGLRLLTLAVFGWFIWMMGQQASSTTVAGEHTAVVDIVGTIEDGGPANAHAVMAAMREAMAAPNARAMVLRINSPGGSPVHAGMIYDEIHRLRQQHDKPVYAVVEEMCASAAYYIAAAADEVYADRASVVGSIGVLMDGFGFTGTMEKLGVERRLLTAGRNKAMRDPFSPENEEHTAHMQALLDEIHQQFIEAVQKGRGARLKVDENTFSGLVWSGQGAIAQGLVDGLGTVDSIARDKVQAEDIIDYTHQENMAERLAKQIGVSAGAGAAGVLTRAQQWLPALR